MDSVKSVRLTPAIEWAVKDRAKREKVDESTAIRQLIAWGAETYAVELYGRGEVTLPQAARLAGTTVRDMLEVLWRRGVKGNVTLEVYLQGQEHARRLWEQHGASRSSKSRS